MPRNDGTGPRGQGAMSGRGMGYCMLRLETDRPSFVGGFVGIDGIPIGGIEATEEVNMPGGDGTGPRGMGPMTGRAAGDCAGYSVPGYMNPVMGRGVVWRRGIRRRGNLTSSYSEHVDTTATREQEMEALKAQTADLQGALQGLQQRISELESNGETDPSPVA